MSYRTPEYVARAVKTVHAMTRRRVYLYHVENSSQTGLGILRNRLGHMGRSGLILFVNGDVILSPGWDDLLADTLDAKSGAAEALLVGDPRFRGRWERLVGDGPPGRAPDGLPSVEHMAALIRRISGEPRSLYRRDLLMPLACVLFRRQVWERIGGWDERFRLFGIDREMVGRLYDLGIPVVLSNACPVWHAGGLSFARATVDRSAERHHADAILSEIAAGRLERWDRMTEEARRAVREDPSYGRIPSY